MFLGRKRQYKNKSEMRARADLGKKKKRTELQEIIVIHINISTKSVL